MGFLKKVGKSLKKVTKSVSKVVKPVVKNIVPLAATAVGTYLGGPIGGAAASGLSSIFGPSKLGDSIGSAVGQGVQNTISGIGRSLAGYDTPTGGVYMPQMTTPQLPGALSNDMYSGLSHIQGMQTPIKSATEQGQDTRDYLASAYPELNPWERSGTGGTMFGSEMTGDIQSQEQANKMLVNSQLMQKQAMQKDLALALLNSETQLAINRNNNDTALQSALIGSGTQLETAGIASQTSRANTYDQVNIGQQNVDIARRRLDADVGKIAADTDLSKQAKEESIARTLKTFAEVHNVELSGSQIKAMTQQALAAAGQSGAQARYTGELQRSEKIKQKGYEQENLNLRYGQGTFSREASSISNAISDLFPNIFSGFTGDSTGGVRGAMFPQGVD